MKILFIFGTRPEAIKMWPLYLELKQSENIHCLVCVTGQHNTILHQFLDALEIAVDYDLAVMTVNQTPSSVISKSLIGIEAVINNEKPNLLLVHGDTSTAVAGALAGFNNQIPIGHVEAGLRTGELSAPFPEEGNRRLVAQVASYHFAPTESAKNNLLKENICDRDVVVTGNTIVDAVLSATSVIEDNEKISEKLNDFFRVVDFGKKIVFVTGHRRESVGSGVESICRAVIQITQKDESVQVVFSVHPNPAIKETVYRLLDGCQNIILMDPLDYLQCIYLMSKSHLIITDSGGIQEEAPSLGVPVIITRRLTERPETVDAGFAKLVDTDENMIVETAINLLNNDTRADLRKKQNPFGDGRAARQIKNFIIKRLR